MTPITNININININIKSKYRAKYYDRKTAKSMIVLLVTEWYDLMLLLRFIYSQLIKKNLHY